MGISSRRNGYQLDVDLIGARDADGELVGCDFQVFPTLRLAQLDAGSHSSWSRVPV